MSMAPPEEAPSAPAGRRSTSWLVLTLVGAASLCLVGIVLVGAIAFPVIRQRRHDRQRSSAVANMKDIATAIDMYAGDHDGWIPQPDNWMDSTSAYVANQRDFHAPGLPRWEFGIALRASLAGKPLNGIQDVNTTALVFDSTLHSRNAIGDLSTLPKPPRYGVGTAGGNVVGFSNGTSRLIPADEQGALK